MRGLPIIFLVCGLGFVPGAGAETVTITREDCGRLVRHVPAPDVAYQAGRDVYGRPVVPADLNPSPLRLPETFTIDITTDVIVEGPFPLRPFEAEVRVGQVVVDGDRITFNGHPVTDEAEAELAAKCQRILRDRP